MFRLAVVAALLLVSGAALADAQAVGRRVRVNGMQMYYEVSGAGDPLVVLHGAYMNIPAMGTIIPKLAKTHRVYAVELQGHGRTTDVDRPITYPNMAEDVAAFMDAVGLKKADVFDLLYSFIEPFLKGRTKEGDVREVNTQVQVSPSREGGELKRDS
jgi:hypothetical protein